MNSKRSPAERAVWWLGAATLLLFFVGIGMGIYFKLDSLHRDHQVRALALHAQVTASQTHLAGCNLQDSLKDSNTFARKQLLRSEHFLRMHPHGIPGIPPRLFRLGIRDDRVAIHNRNKTIQALAPLHCESHHG